MSMDAPETVPSVHEGRVRRGSDVGGEVLFRNAKDSLDAVEVPDRNLDMVLFHERRARIERRLFLKDGLDAVDGRLAVARADFMQIVDNGAIERVPEFSGAVHRQFAIQ